MGSSRAVGDKVDAVIIEVPKRWKTILRCPCPGRREHGGDDVVAEFGEDGTLRAKCPDCGKKYEVVCGIYGGKGARLNLYSTEIFARADPVR